MIQTNLSRNQDRDKRMEHRSAVQTFTNLIAEGTSCSRFEAQVVSAKAEEVFGLGEHGIDQRLQPGQMLWRAISADEPPGKPLSACVFKTIVLSVHRLDEDRNVKACHGMSAKRQQQILRMCSEALEQDTLLTQEDLGVILDCDVKTIRNDIAKYRGRTDNLVPTRGTKQDIGPGVTHREQVIELFVAGEEHVAIARKLKHSLKAVERYIESFCRILFAYDQLGDTFKTALVTGVSISLVLRCTAMRDKLKNTLEYREKLAEIERLGSRYWEAADQKKRPSRKEGPST